jgi:hypothetical protein
VGFIVASLIIAGGVIGRLLLSPFLLSRAAGSPHPLYEAESYIARQLMGIAVGALSGGALGLLLCLTWPMAL